MKILFVILGFLTLALGAAGVVLPVLPSTPFLLIAAFCFAKSSERLNSWFKQTKLYRSNLETLVKGQGMTWAAKLRIMGTVTVIMAVAFVLMRNTTAGRICLAVVWLCHVIAFCFYVKTCRPEKAAAASIRGEAPAAAAETVPVTPEKTAVTPAPAASAAPAVPAVPAVSAAAPAASEVAAASKGGAGDDDR